MPSSVANKRVIVFGGGGAIGGGAALLLARGGAKVYSFVRKESSIPANKPEGWMRHAAVDVGDREAVYAAVDKAVIELGGLDAIINAAGLFRGTSVDKITEDEIDQMYRVNVKGTLFTSLASIPYMRASGGGSIINIGSDSATEGIQNGVSYSASKAAVNALSRAISTEVGKDMIRVNVVNPCCDSVMGEDFAKSRPSRQAHEETFKHRIYLGGKAGDALKDIAPVLEFLVSDDSHFVTGQIIGANGGMICSH
ncbi:NADP-dependent 3-hydroxy acid dehydrogenase [Sphaceloma murrayae]|uniref:NADP-dependent 3-hydroxy acid dehydrogenase n=1 Tax=Sphaceloma murrayae TaxID=2082308 RepID=A0A2K1QGP7_9PEZI|nr:NADP-dependent 3-hydroxy acid dehydrogenase [Sphaceloma murrayae]